MKGIKRIISAFLCGVMTAAALSAMTLTSSATVTGTGCYTNGYYDQHNQFKGGSYYWKQPKYTYTWNSGKNSTTLYQSGCGIFSFCNAIRALNGITADAPTVSSWARTNGYYVGSTDRSFYGTKLQNAYGTKYKFQFAGSRTRNINSTNSAKSEVWNSSSKAIKDLKAHLQNGGVAVAHTGGSKNTAYDQNHNGHYICISNYRTYNGADQFYVIESWTRFDGFGVENGIGWVNLDTLTKKHSSKNWYRVLDWFVMLKSTDKYRNDSVNHWSRIKNAASDDKSFLKVNSGVDQIATAKTGLIVDTKNKKYSANQDFLLVRTGSTTYSGKTLATYMLIPAMAPDCAVSYLYLNTTYLVELEKKNANAKSQQWFFEPLDNACTKFRIHNLNSPSVVMTVNSEHKVRLEKMNGSTKQTWTFPNINI